MGRRFVPQSTIERRVQAKDDRINAQVRARRHTIPTIDEQIAAFRQRTGGAGPDGGRGSQGVTSTVNADRAPSDRRACHPDPVCVDVLDPSTVFLCHHCDLPSVNTGDFPYCSAGCRCEARTSGDT